MLQDSGVFEMLTLAQELGVEELRSTCEDHVTSTLSVLNVCTFLAAAMDIQDRPAGTVIIMESILVFTFVLKVFNHLEVLKL